MPRRRRSLRGWAVIGGIAAAGLLLALANVHLVYVAFSSQPDCVEHSKGPGEVPGTFRAAKSAC
ncbi:MAG: hypothetical protein RH942_00875 [Kiloniellaceae bacterium]